MQKRYKMIVKNDLYDYFKASGKGKKSKNNYSNMLQKI